MDASALRGAEELATSTMPYAQVDKRDSVSEVGNSRSSLSFLLPLESDFVVEDL